MGNMAYMGIKKGAFQFSNLGHQVATTKFKTKYKHNFSATCSLAWLSGWVLHVFIKAF